MPKDYRMSEAERERIRDIASTFFPVRPRRSGVLFDLFVSNPDVQGYRLEEVFVRTLLVSARDDTMSAYDNSLAAQGRICGSEILSFDRGGHLLLGVEASVRDHLSEFVAGSRK